MPKKVLHEGTITVTRTIEVLENGHNWHDKVTIEGLPKGELEDMLECDLIDLNETVPDAIYMMEDEELEEPDGVLITYLNLPAFTAERGGIQYGK